MPVAKKSMDQGKSRNPEWQSEHNSEITRGVKILSGDPKIAILKLSGPMIVAMLLMSIYNVIDAIWVAGLGSDALAAVGFIMPLFMIFIGLGNGLGAGANSAISRRIGAKDKVGADSTSVHALLLIIAISIILTIPLIVLLEPIVIMLGAGNAADLAVEYGQIIFSGTIFILFANIAYAILRAEGDTKRTMYAMGMSSIINMVLDPILIYYAGMGIAGAAFATIISITLVSAVLIYWFLIKKNTYITLSWKEFSPDRKVITDILKVGLPASAEFLLMSIMVVILNGILVTTSGTDAVAVYTAGWRIVMIAIIPLVAIATSCVSVVGASYGARHYEKLKIIHSYSIKFGLIISFAISILTWLLAPQIAVIFTYTPESAYLAPIITAFLRTMCLFYPFIPPGIMSSAIFQGTGKGTTSLVINLLRGLVFIAVFAYILGIMMGMGQVGVWWGIVAGDILGCIVGLIWARFYITRLPAVDR